MSDVILSRAGYEQLQAELEILTSKERKKVADQLEKARAHGDLRENAEYDSAKMAKQQLEARIQILQDKLVRAKIVDASEGPTDKVYFGTTVLAENQKAKQEVTFTLVAEDEADIAKGRISVQSPIAKALLGHAVGELVEVKVPAGIIHFKILKISR